MKLFIYNSKYLISICFTQYFLDKRISRYVHRQLCRQVLRLSDNGRKTYPHYHAPCYTQQQRPSLHSRINNFMEKMVGGREETTKHKNKQEVRFPKLTHKAAWANRIITNFASPYRTGTQKFHAPVWWESLCIFKNSETVWTTGIGKCTGENPFFQHNWLSQSLFQILPCLLTDCELSHAKAVVSHFSRQCWRLTFLRAHARICLFGSIQTAARSDQAPNTSLEERVHWPGLSYSGKWS